MRTTIPEPSAGTYTVKWTSVAEDGYVENGSFTFAVAVPSPPISTATPGPTVAVTAPTVAPSEAPSASPAASPSPAPSAGDEPGRAAGRPGGRGLVLRAPPGAAPAHPPSKTFQSRLPLVVYLAGAAGAVAL